MERLPNILTNRQLYKKAYLIEFYKDDTRKPDGGVFTFSLPPQSEELTYSQRKTETKTFGGLHVDNYGVNEVKIILSGSTVNQSLKRIYKGGFEKDEYLSGEDEVYEFRRLLLEYGQIDSLKSYKSPKIIIYDLSKYTELRTKTINNCWQAFVGDYKIRRSEDRPFTYKYTFEFTGVEYTGERIKESTPFIVSKILSALQYALDKIKEVLNFIYGIEAMVDKVLGYVDQISSLMNTLGQITTYATSIVTDTMSSVSNTASRFIGGVTSIVDGANSIASLPRTIQLNILNIGLEIQNATNRLMKSTATLTKTCRDMFSEDGWKIPQEVLDQYNLNDQEYQDSIDIILNRVENAANDLCRFSKSSEIPETTEGVPDPITGEPTIRLSYGYSSVTLKDTDTLESLAVEYFGDPDKAIEIATYNNVTTLNELKPGSVLRIPITEKSKKISNNLIYGRREDRDNYGRDILLTDDGYIVASNTGDYALAGGVNNLSQSVLLRLRESNAKRIRVNTYGIRKSIDQAAGVAYVITSVRLTVNSDPRVAKVDDIQFKAAGDFLDIRVCYHDINNASGIASGRI